MDRLHLYSLCRDFMFVVIQVAGTFTQTLTIKLWLMGQRPEITKTSGVKILYRFPNIGNNL